MHLCCRKGRRWLKHLVATIPAVWSVRLDARPKLLPCHNPHYLLRIWQCYMGPHAGIYFFRLAPLATTVGPATAWGETWWHAAKNFIPKKVTGAPGSLHAFE